VQLGAKVVVLPATHPATVAQARAVSLTSSYAPESRVRQTWASIR